MSIITKHEPPQEIWVKIFRDSSLDLKDLSRCLRACKTWQKKVLDPLIGKKFLLEHKREPIKGVSWFQTYKFWLDNTKFHLFIDGTSSMSVKDSQEGLTRWYSAKKIAHILSKNILSTYPELYSTVFFQKDEAQLFKSSDQMSDYLEKIVLPGGSCQFITSLQEVFNSHFKNKTKCTKIFVISDLDLHIRKKLEILLNKANCLAKKKNSEIKLTFIHMGQNHFGKFIANCLKSYSNLNQNNHIQVDVYSENEIQKPVFLQD